VLTDGTRSHQFTFACVAKSRHYGPIKMVQEADLFREEFFVYGFHSENRLRYFLYALAVLSGTTKRLADVSCFATRQLLCRGVKGHGDAIFLQTDGELAGAIPCSITAVPDALTLLVPLEFREPDVSAAQPVLNPL
jgi:diacylglycerol kinase family enzyme